MTAPVAQADPVIKLHDDLVHPPLHEVEALQRLAWQARGLALKRPNDFSVQLTAMEAYAKAGDHDEAVKYGLRAFDLWHPEALGSEELPGWCASVGLIRQGMSLALRLMNTKSIGLNGDIFKSFAMLFLKAGELGLLDRLGGGALKFINIIEENKLSNVICDHMKIVYKYTIDKECYTEISADTFDDGMLRKSILMHHRLSLPRRDCVNRFIAMQDELESYYLGLGREDMAYDCAIAHDISPMPAFMEQNA